MGTPKFLIAFLALALVGLSTGCAGSTGALPAFGTPAFNQLVVNSQADIQSATAIATTGVLISIPAADRPQFGGAAYTVASAVNSAVASDQIDLTQVEAYAAAQIAKSKVPDKLEVGMLLTQVSNIVQNQLNTKFANADPASKTAAVKALLRGASAGVMDATSAYKSTAMLREDLHGEIMASLRLRVSPMG
jgi:hypothetical protein